MARLFLLRHAKASWAPPGMRDFDRALEPAGVADAEAVGEAMRAHAFVPDLTLCSTAARARQTLEGVAAHADTGRVLFLDALYSEDATGYLAIVRRHGSAGSLLIIGHNPMMEDLAAAVSGEGEDEARAILDYGFPTSGLAVIGFPGGLAAAAPGAGRLEAFLTPSKP